MINLLPTSIVADAKQDRLRRWVLAIATVVLVGYVLLLAGLAGRSWYLSSRKNTVSAEVGQLSDQINQLAAMEAILRQETARLALIQHSLTERISTATAAGIIAAAQVTSWDYTPPQIQKLTIVGSDSVTLEDFATSLTARFSQVSVKKLSFIAGQPWQMDLLLAGSTP